MATIEAITADYCTRNNVTNENLSVEDQKVINVIFKVKQSYATQLEKRKCSILLEKPPQSYETKTETTLEVKPKVQKTSQPEKESVTICKAITMKGTPCKSKAKPGCEYCGKHLPK